MANLRSLWSAVPKFNFFGVHTNALQVRCQSNSSVFPATKYSYPSPVPKLGQPEGPAGIYDNDKWVNAWMKRDVKRRRANRDYAELRVRLMALKRCTILPKEIRAIADKQMLTEVPRISSVHQLTHRCVLTSRSHGVIYPWRLSRFVFRHMADYNKIAGIQRAMW
ncbi:28S ribosomal protein S14, mitochondrial [Microplitis demolitor]|uniref:28S ribosomal protein S14, mitochondrial n=1 Tax=Microplitis demolitor TaxID=69319 RepID=UPI0004CD6D88|nr:28S ribosomal protein S14, mitochondrial [Microplitis demolitor]